MSEYVRVRVSDVIVEKRRNSRREPQTPAELAELAADIEKQGLLQAPVVRLIDEGYLLVVGYRRLAACRSLNERMAGARMHDPFGGDDVYQSSSSLNERMGTYVGATTLAGPGTAFGVGRGTDARLWSERGAASRGEER